MSSVMTPKEIVDELNRFIIGQTEAKRAVAIALRNRWRRLQVPEALRAEITPKNILMIGPTGVGKTEIARRLAKLANAPFIKVEATKFTEVGYVGRDVESIIRDLVDVAVKMTREQEMGKVRHVTKEIAEERVLDILLPPLPPEMNIKLSPEEGEAPQPDPAEKHKKARQLMRKRLRTEEFNDKEIEVEIAAPAMGVEIMAPPGMEEMTSQLQSMFQNIAGEKKKSRKLKVKDALKLIQEEEASKLIDKEGLERKALHNVEQNGIVFIDELDKIAKRGGQSTGGDVSREGVQRDLLPLVEGSTVQTRYGMVKTDHVLFIASGAFHVAKPSDLIPELQGRLPIRVELKSLTADDFCKILTEPDASLTEQYSALLNTEGVTLKFKSDGVKRIAEIASQVNEKMENIGARRLHTVMERLLEKISFDACDTLTRELEIDAAYVDEQLKLLATNEDLSQYIL